MTAMDVLYTLLSLPKVKDKIPSCIVRPRFVMGGKVASKYSVSPCIGLGDKDSAIVGDGLLIELSDKGSAVMNELFICPLLPIVLPPIYPMGDEDIIVAPPDKDGVDIGDDIVPFPM